MSAEYLMNDDIPTETSKPDVPNPTYFDLVSMRIEAGARLSRAIKTLRDADVLPSAELMSDGLAEALKIAERHWADICMGLVPVRSGDVMPTIKLTDALPACVEAFRVIVMEHAQREALDRECRIKIDHVDGFKILTRPQTLHLENKHVCDGGCRHD